MDDKIQADNGNDVNESRLFSFAGVGPSNEIGVKIDWTKPVRIIGSKRAVHIYAIDHSLRKPVLGRVDGDPYPTDWRYDGRFLRDGEASVLNLENVPEDTK